MPGKAVPLIDEKIKNLPQFISRPKKECRNVLWACNLQSKLMYKMPLPAGLGKCLAPKES
jgi:predicted PP-loop superfamily ATPase